jgi:hypothetical protein
VRARRTSRTLAAVLAVAGVLVGAADAREAVLNKRARLREGPSATTALVDWVAEGTRVDVLGEDRGWRQVTLPDGRAGYIWGEHLDEAGTAAPATAPTETAAPRPPEAPAEGAGRGGGVLDELRALRTDVTALRERADAQPEPDVERLRAEIERLALVQRDLVRRLDSRPSFPVDGGATDAWTGGHWLAVAGGVVGGWALSRLLQRRRERRNRVRLRL